MMAIGISYGAITVINAIPCGIGATIGINLETKAKFSIGGNSKVVNIINDGSEDTLMSRVCIQRVYEYFGIVEPKGWTLEISSQIPISKGLKSSSAACNQILKAVTYELGMNINLIDLIHLGVRCAREAQVTVTGSFDDACGSGFGGFVMTDNLQDTIINRHNIGTFDVIIYSPNYKIKKRGLLLDRFHAVSSYINKAIELAIDDPFEAMTLNGDIISAVMGIDNNIAKRAMKMGAIGAGLSGLGPSVAIVVEHGQKDEFINKLGISPKEIISANTRCEE